MDEQTNSAIIALWEQFKDAILAHVDAVDEAVGALRGGTIDLATRQTAEREAHKLAGSLGTFGFHDAGRASGQLERAFAERASLRSDQASSLESLVDTIRRDLTRAPNPGAADPSIT